MVQSINNLLCVIDVKLEILQSRLAVNKPRNTSLFRKLSLLASSPELWVVSTSSSEILQNRLMFFGLFMASLDWKIWRFTFMTFSTLLTLRPRILKFCGQNSGYTARPSKPKFCASACIQNWKKNPFWNRMMKIGICSKTLKQFPGDLKVQKRHLWNKMILNEIALWISLNLLQDPSFFLWKGNHDNLFFFLSWDEGSNMEREKTWEMSRTTNKILSAFFPLTLCSNRYLWSVCNCRFSIRCSMQKNREIFSIWYLFFCHPTFIRDSWTKTFLLYNQPPVHCLESIGSLRENRDLNYRQKFCRGTLGKITNHR